MQLLFRMLRGKLAPWNLSGRSFSLQCAWPASSYHIVSCSFLRWRSGCPGGHITRPKRLSQELVARAHHHIRTNAHISLAPSCSSAFLAASLSPFCKPIFFSLFDPPFISCSQATHSHSFKSPVAFLPFTYRRTSSRCVAIHLVLRLAG
ncbi:hypothetical protein M011DRAFT_353 [Sporormia fimetaria CBS 119925]|uniref:Uncharacterized protein n=1 Tax=Sporormia fimetaria CBS 119925 TaxID=1340428 RepID=A0A6A6VM14_9PLEO|nr:hypothetical protein M011DRAFT_353 [Sporormia fimetaria CBS 119925]